MKRRTVTAVPASGGRRRTKTDAVKILEGTFRKDLGSVSELTVREAAELPDWAAERILKHFDHLRALIEPFGYDSASFASVLALAASRMVEIEDYNALISVHGELVETESGTLKANPAVGMRSDAQRHLHTLLCEVGLTPSAAGRLSRDKYEAKKQANKEENVGFGGL